MDDLAMKYEHLIGDAYNCGRWQAPGVNADIYRDLVECYVKKNELLKSLESPKSIESIESLKSLNDYYLALGEVITHIKHAFFEYKNANSENKDFCKQLDSCGEKLFYNPSLDNVDKCMNEAEEILKTVHILL